MNRWTKLYKRIVPGMPWRREAWRRRPKDQKLLTLTPSTWLSMPSGWLSLSKKKEFATLSPDGDGVFRIAKQMDCTNQDFDGENCVCNDAGELVLTDKDTMKAWVEYYARLINVAFHWSSSEQFGFVLGRGTTDTIFVVRQLQEKNIVAKKLFYVYLCRLWENIWPCAKERSMVGLKGPQGQEMGGMCHPGHVLHCPESCVQWWVWHGSWCAWGLCP